MKTFSGDFYNHFQSLTLNNQASIRQIESKLQVPPYKKVQEVRKKFQALLLFFERLQNVHRSSVALWKMWQCYGRSGVLPDPERISSRHESRNCGTHVELS